MFPQLWLGEMLQYVTRIYSNASSTMLKALLPARFSVLCHYKCLVTWYSVNVIAYIGILDMLKVHNRAEKMTKSFNKVHQDSWMCKEQRGDITMQDNQQLWPLQVYSVIRPTEGNETMPYTRVSLKKGEIPAREMRTQHSK